MDGQVTKVGVHDVISNVASCTGFNVNVHSAEAPVLFDTAVISPAAPTVSDAKYCEGVVEQPAKAGVVGIVPPCADVYSATEVLHAAMAAKASDIFERTMKSWYAGSAIAARMPTMATTIISSMSVKPF